MADQSLWRYCAKCQGLFFDGSPTKGTCAAGGAHAAAGYTFVLPHDVPGTLTAQDAWRYCGKCQSLFYDGYPAKGTCAAGGGHAAAGYNFVLPHDVVGTATNQNDWRYCSKCQGMFYDGYPEKGRCPAGGGHASIGYNFFLPYTPGITLAVESIDGDDQVIVSGVGFTPTSRVGLNYGFNTPDGYFSNGVTPTWVTTDANGSFAGVQLFTLRRDLGDLTNIGVQAVDERKHQNAEASLPDRYQG